MRRSKFKSVCQRKSFLACLLHTPNDTSLRNCSYSNENEGNAIGNEKYQLQASVYGFEDLNVKIGYRGSIIGGTQRRNEFKKIR